MVCISVFVTDLGESIKFMKTGYWKSQLTATLKLTVFCRFFCERVKDIFYLYSQKYITGQLLYKAPVNLSFWHLLFIPTRITTKNLRWCMVFNCWRYMVNFMPNDLIHFVPMAEVATRGVLCKKCFLTNEELQLYLYSNTGVFLWVFELFMDSGL